MKLSTKTLEMLTLLSQGLTLKEIAFHQSVKEKALEKRLERLRKEHRCKNTTQLISMMIKEKVIAV